MTVNFLFKMSISVKPLGAGQEVGRSCVIVKVKDLNIMFDCGVHMAYNDSRKFPDFKKIVENDEKYKKKIQFSNKMTQDREESMYQNLLSDTINYTEVVDLVIITHFHLDHCGALPYFTEISGYKGPIITSQPTKAIIPLMLEDFRKIIESSEKSVLTQQNIKDCMKKITTVEVNEEKIVRLTSKNRAIKVTAFYAGHVLGACMYNIEIDGFNVTYTGDYNTLADRHLGGAYMKKISPDILITETTYGNTVRDTKRVREREFLKKIQNTIDKNGKVLIPVFALGRAQELCILLDTHWRRMKSNVPIYFAGQMTGKANFYYKIFNNWMNDKIKNVFLENNVFEFKFIQPYDKTVLKSNSPMVIFATPGMLHGGISLSIFKEIAGDPKNMVIIPGYCTQGTVGNKILSGERLVEIDKSTIEVRCDVEYMSFSAHADAKGILQLIKHSSPKNIVFVHGDSEVMKKLQKTVEVNLKLNSFLPKNHEEIFFYEKLKMFERIPMKSDFFYFIQYLAKIGQEYIKKNGFSLESGIRINLEASAITSNKEMYRMVTEKNDNLHLGLQNNHLRKFYNLLHNPSGNLSKKSVKNNFIISLLNNQCKTFRSQDFKSNLAVFINGISIENRKEIISLIERKNDEVDIKIINEMSSLIISWKDQTYNKSIFTLINVINLYIKLIKEI